MNNVVLVGKLVSADEKNIKIAINRPYKNMYGEYETDFITATMGGQIAKSVIEYCKNGDVIAIKGRMENDNKIIVEKVSFLSSSQQKHEHEFE